jgi:hypothetical protein
MAVLDESTRRIIPKMKTLFEIAKPRENSALLNNLLKESKGKYTDYVSVNWRDKADEITMEPTDRNWKLYKDIYEKVGIIKNCIDNTADFALQSGYELEGPVSGKEKIEKFIKKTNFDLILHNILKQMQIYGNCFIELSRETIFSEDTWSLKILPPDQMRVVVYKGKGKDGQLKGYKQMQASSQSIEFSPEEVVHFKWNTATTTGQFYGVSDLKAVCGSLTSLLNFQEDIGEIIHRYAAPIIHWALGTEEQSATAAEIAEFISLLNDRDTGQDMVTSSNVKANPIVNNLKMVQPDGMIKLLENQLIAGLRVPEIFIRGGETSNKATADVELQAFDRKVKAIRMALSTMVEDFIFKKITPTSEVTISWNELSVESEHTKAQQMQWLVQSGVPTKVALDMCGWGSWIDDFEEEKQKEQDRASSLALTALPPGQNPKPVAQAKPPADNKPIAPKEEDFETQEEWFEAYRNWEKGKSLNK